MNLSMTLIGKYLSNYKLEYHIENDTLSIKGLRIISDSLGNFSTDYVYVGDAKEYYQDIRYQNALLLASGQNQILCYGIEYEELLNLVLSAFEYYNKIEQNIIMNATKHQPLKTLITETSKLYDGAILVFDLDGNLLADINAGMLTDDILYKTISHEKRMGLDSIGNIFINEDGNISHDLSDCPKYFSKQDYSKGTVAMYLNVNYERIGFIMLFPNNELEISIAVHLLNHFGHYYALTKEFTNLSSNLLPKSTILQALLDGKNLNNDIMNQLDKMFQLDISNKIIIFENQGIKNYTIYRLINKELSSISQNMLCEYQNSIVILAEGTNLQRIIEFLKHRMPSNNFKIGVSMPIQNPNQILMAYRQAKFALETNTNPGIYYCEDFAMEYLIQNLKKQDMAMELLHPAIGILNHYDCINHTELLSTTQFYIKNGCNQVKTAEQMNIHLNTLKYRLKRIEEIGRLDFKNNNEIFYLRLSIEILNAKAS